MSGKLDQSLDEILVTQRGATRGRGGRGRRVRGAPVGGIKKTVARVPTKPAAKGPTRAAQAAPVSSGATKIIVSNLPTDVSEGQIKEYFTQAAGHIKHVNLAYGPTGKSKGIATIIFSKPSSGAKALEANGLKVDNKPMKIEAVFDPSHIPGKEVKTLSDRVSGGKPKVEPKQAKAAKPAEAATRGARRGGRGGRAPRGGRSGGRPKAKTADELDAEMTDYFTTTNGGEAVPTASAAAPAVAATNGDDAGMDVIT